MIPVDLAGLGSFPTNATIDVYRRDGVTPGPAGVECRIRPPGKDRFNAAGAEQETTILAEIGTDLQDGDLIQVRIFAGRAVESTRRFKVATAVPLGDQDLTAIRGYIIGFRL